MAKNVRLLGADYPDVPAVQLPQTGGGTAVFTDVSDTTATPSDVISGKSFYDGNGVRQVGSYVPIKTEPFDVTATTNTSVGGSWYNGIANLPSVSGTIIGVVFTNVMDTTYYDKNVFASVYDSGKKVVGWSMVQGRGVRMYGNILYI